MAALRTTGTAAVRARVGRRAAATTLPAGALLISTCVASGESMMRTPPARFQKRRLSRLHASGAAGYSDHSIESPLQHTRCFHLRCRDWS